MLSYLHMASRLVLPVIAILEVNQSNAGSGFVY